MFMIHKHFSTTIFYYIDWTSINLIATFSFEPPGGAQGVTFRVFRWLVSRMGNFEPEFMTNEGCVMLCLFSCWRIFVGVHPDPWGR